MNLNRAIVCTYH